VTAGQPLARLVDRGDLWLDVGVPQAYVGRLGEVAGAWFRIDGANEVLEVSRDALISIGAAVDPATRTLAVRFRLEAPSRSLFAGMTALAYLVTDAVRQVPAVPRDSVVDDSGMDVVYVQTGGESFVRRPVRLGIRDGAYVEITEGVEPGEWVVARGAYLVKLASTSTESVGHGHAH
jgi:multidrug efflux pump subunit AcrA (membrane-fusion protein)